MSENDLSQLSRDELVAIIMRQQALISQLERR